MDPQEQYNEMKRRREITAHNMRSSMRQIARATEGVDYKTACTAARHLEDLAQALRRRVELERAAYNHMTEAQ